MIISLLATLFLGLGDSPWDPRTGEIEAQEETPAEQPDSEKKPKALENKELC